MFWSPKCQFVESYSYKIFNTNVCNMFQYQNLSIYSICFCVVFSCIPVNSNPVVRLKNNTTPRRSTWRVKLAKKTCFNLTCVGEERKIDDFFYLPEKFEKLTNSLHPLKKWPFKFDMVPFLKGRFVHVFYFVKNGGVQKNQRKSRQLQGYRWHLCTSHGSFRGDGLDVWRELEGAGSWNFCWCFFSSWKSSSVWYGGMVVGGFQSMCACRFLRFCSPLLEMIQVDPIWLIFVLKWVETTI